MKWILFLATLVSLPINAAQQYTEAECILIKQQVADYKRKSGSSSGLYIQSKASFDNHCQNPVQPKTGLPQLNTKQVDKQSHIAAPELSQNVPELAKPATEPASIVSTLIKTLLPILFLVVFVAIALVYFKKKLPQIKGRLGEKYVIKGLERHLSSDEYNIINDVTLPLEDGGTTQIDHIVVSRFGVFVIETKNMAGWIFGNEKQAKWTQTIHRTKHQFQNPLRQNYKHTKTLSELLDLPHDVFHSVVVFTPNAELKTKMPDNVGHLKDMMSYIKAFNEEIIDYKLTLKVLKHVDMVKLKQKRKTNKRHINYLNEKRSDSLSS